MQTHTSFIPKKDFSRDKARGGNYVGLTTIVSSVVFVAMCLIAAGVFFYNQFLVSEIEKNSTILAREKGNLDLGIIQELDRLDKKIESAKKILDKHISLLPLFELLEKNTLRNVRFDNFDFDIGKDGIFIEMDGFAGSYAVLALQSDTFGKNKNIIDPIFSDLGVSLAGKVTFTMSAKVDPRLISFRNSVGL